MKVKSYIIFMLAVFVFAGVNLSGQTEPKPPKDVLAPFPEFDQMARKNEDKILKSLPPDVKEDLLKIKNIDEEKYYEILSGAPNFWFDLDESFMFDPMEKKRMEQSQLVDHWEMHTDALGFLYQHAKPNEQPQLKSKLKTKLEQLFDLKEKERSLEVEMLERELKELKESLEVRKKNKAEIINNRLNELIGLDNYLDW